MEKTALSLRKHLVWILLIKVAAIIALRLLFFTPVQASHTPADLFEPSSPTTTAEEPS